MRLALVRLQGFPYPLDLGAAYTGAATTAADTIPALLAVWTVATYVIGMRVFRWQW